MSEFVRVENPEHGIVRLLINRPEKRNPIDPQTRGELAEAFEAASNDHGVRAIIITGAGGVFCAGGDLSTMEGFTPHSAHGRMRLAHRLPKLISASPVPVVAAVEGYALGAGAGLALLADTIVMGSSGVLGFPFSRLGLVPDYGILYSLPRRVGAAVARQALLYGRNYRAEDALKIGLVDELVPDDAVQESALARARELAIQPRLATALVRQLLRDLPPTLDAALESEAMAQALCFNDAEFEEGLAAFREKRRPHFGG
ncbi:MAG: enoyl-CoA hydratase/isomerase family protein [Gammaproteobacteria bacterium]|nr:enoyl-CoA hydratase/isomerase family protein [Gammaproteobacteria bacterium]